MKYKNRYRIKSARAPWWNYNWVGSYFITMVTDDRGCIFGEIIDGEMQLSPVGEIVLDEWQKSFEIRSELFCDEFVIMPNHIHAVLRIVRNNRFGVRFGDNAVGIIDGCDGNFGGGFGGGNAVETNERLNAVSAETIKNYGVAYRPPRSISSFVAGFKSAATKRINEYRNTPRKPVWQPRFHDRIIRNTREYHRIIWYIRNNPKKWQEDRFRGNDKHPTDVSEKTSVKQTRYNRTNRTNRINQKSNKL